MIRKRMFSLLFCLLTVVSMILFPLGAGAGSSVTATTDDGTVSLYLDGNITSSDMNNIMITRNHSAETATLSFRVIGKTGDTGFCNITVSKNSIYNGISPTILVDGKPSEDSGFAQDDTNYYVWYLTYFSNEGQSISFATHDLSITFIQTSDTPSATNPPSSNSIPIMWIIIIIALIIISSIGIILFLRRRGSKSS